VLLPILALLSWAACSEQPNSPTVQQEIFPAGQEPLNQTMEGTLTKVDPESKRISIRTADGSERSFSYSDLTLITGSEDTVEGLAKVNGARVKIWYALGGQGNEAEEIEILTGQAGTPPVGGMH
jgi:hypothetical protein